MECYAQNHRRLMKLGCIRCKLSDWQLAALSIRAPHSCVLFRQEDTVINSITIDQNIYLKHTIETIFAYMDCTRDELRLNGVLSPPSTSRRQLSGRRIPPT